MSEFDAGEYLPLAAATGINGRAYFPLPFAKAAIEQAYAIGRKHAVEEATRDPMEDK